MVPKRGRLTAVMVVALLVALADARATPSPIGEQRTLVLLLNFLDDPSTPIPAGAVETYMFDESHPQSVAAYYREVSYGKAWITGDVLDWTTLPVPTADCLQYADINDAASIQRTADYVDPLVDFSAYERLVVFIPGCPGTCGACGAFEPFTIVTDEGTFEVTVTRVPPPATWPSTDDPWHTVIHELGHNLRLLHAHDLECGDLVVGDVPGDCQSVRGFFMDTMGIGIRRHFNAAYKDFLGWFEPENVVEVEDATTEILLAPLEITTTEPQMIRIRPAPYSDGSSTLDHLFVEYRQPIGFDAPFTTQSGDAEGVFVSLGPRSLAPWPQTHLLDMRPNVTTPGLSQVDDSRDADLRVGEWFHDARGSTCVCFMDVPTPGRARVRVIAGSCTDPAAACAPVPTTTTTSSSTTTTTTLPRLATAATKLVVVDKLSAAGKAKVVFVAKDGVVDKGTGTDETAIAATFTAAYGGAGVRVEGGFTVPEGDFDGTSGWKVNRETVAKFVNKAAPGGPSATKVVVVKPGRLLKLVGKSLGDASLDVLVAGPPAGSVETAFCVTNGDEGRCHCSEFTDCTYKEIAASTGAKLVCRAAVPDATCLALRPPCGDGLLEGPETCDPPETCPVTCDDGDACTVDTAIGDPAECTAACIHDPIEVCSDGDGCCPSGCDAATDGDCPYCLIDEGTMVLDTCTGLTWEKKVAYDGTPDPANLNDADNDYTWAGQCVVGVALCQPTAEAEAACRAQTPFAMQAVSGCLQCDVGACDVDPIGFGVVTTVWDWLAQLNDAAFAGHTDWRLPFVDHDGRPAELETILDCSFGIPCIDPVFGPTAPGNYWSAVTAASVPTTTWSPDFFVGDVAPLPKTSGFTHVRAVR